MQIQEVTASHPSTPMQLPPSHPNSQQQHPNSLQVPHNSRAGHHPHPLPHSRGGVLTPHRSLQLSPVGAITTISKQGLPTHPQLHSLLGTTPSQGLATHPLLLLPMQPLRVPQHKTLQAQHPCKPLHQQTLGLLHRRDSSSSCSHSRVLLQAMGMGVLTMGVAGRHNHYSSSRGVMSTPTISREATTGSREGM